MLGKNGAFSSIEQIPGNNKLSSISNTHVNVMGGPTSDVYDDGYNELRE